MRGWVILAVLIAAWAYGIHLDTTRPQDVPWTSLDLDAPVGMATGWKLDRLKDDPAACRALLAKAGVAFTPVPDRVTGPGCGWRGAVRLEDPGVPLRPGGAVLSCPAAAALVVWTRGVVIPQTAALGTRATGLVHFGTYNCRSIAGSASISQHATANAIDIAAVRTPTGDIALLRDWTPPGPRRDYLLALWRGGCDSFTTVLGPAYNAAHRDHFHMDMGRWNACR